MCRGGGLPVRFSVGGRSSVIRPGSGRVVSGMPLTKLIYARTRIVAPQCENRGHAVGDARGGGVVPPGHGAGDLVGADGHARSDLPHAVRHLLPRAALRNAALDAARLASALSDHSLRRRLFPAAAPRPDGGAGGDDLRAGARGDGRRGDRGHARRQCRHDGHVQPPVQYGRGVFGGERRRFETRIVPPDAPERPAAFAIDDYLDANYGHYVPGKKRQPSETFRKGYRQ